MKNSLLTAGFVMAAFLLQAQQVELDSVGGKTNIGISLGDGLGPVMRHYLNTRTVLEAGMYAGVALAPQEDNGGSNPGGAFNTEFGFMVDFAVHAYGKRFYKPEKNRIKAHGFALRTGHVFGKFSTSLLSAGWTQEVFRERSPKRSFIFELGLKGYLPHWDAFKNSEDSEIQYKMAEMVNFGQPWKQAF